MILENESSNGKKFSNEISKSEDFHKIIVSVPSVPTKQNLNNILQNYQTKSTISKMLLKRTKKKNTIKDFVFIL